MTGYQSLVLQQLLADTLQKLFAEKQQKKMAEMAFIDHNQDNSQQELLTPDLHHTDGVIFDSEPLHERVLTDVKLTQQNPPSHLLPQNAHHLSSNRQSADLVKSTTHHSMMAPMMSLGVVNFPVAFFTVTTPLEFALLILSCFLISFLVELARVRNAIGSVTSFVNRLRDRKVPIKRYTPIVDQNIGLNTFGLGLGKPSFGGTSETDSAGTKSTDPNEDDQNNNCIIKSETNSSSAVRLKKRHNIPLPNRHLNNFCVPDHQVSEPPVTSGPVVRFLHLFHNFVMIFLHYFIMICAMANFWILLSICAGAALGYLFGSWSNDREAARLCKKLSAKKSNSANIVSDDEEAGIKSAAPSVKVEARLSEDSFDDGDGYDRIDQLRNSKSDGSHDYCSLMEGKSNQSNQVSDENEVQPAATGISETTTPEAAPSNSSNNDLFSQ